MAQFEVLSLERKDGVYLARIAIDGAEAKNYEIRTNAHLSFIPFLPQDLRFHILSSFDTSFGDDKPRFMIRGTDELSERENEEKIRRAFEEFVEQYSLDSSLDRE